MSHPRFQRIFPARVDESVAQVAVGLEIDSGDDAVVDAVGQAGIEISDQLAVDVDFLAVDVISCDVARRGHRGRRSLVAGSEGGDQVSELVIDGGAGHVADRRIAERRGVELHGITFLLLTERMLHVVASGDIVVYRLEPAGIGEVEMPVGGESSSEPRRSGHQVALLHVGVVALDVAAVVELEGGVGVQRAEVLAPQQFGVHSLVVFVCCGELFGAVGVVGAEVEASRLLGLEALAGGELPDVGVGPHPYHIRRGSRP